MRVGKAGAPASAERRSYTLLGWGTSAAPFVSEVARKPAKSETVHRAKNVAKRKGRAASLPLADESLEAEVVDNNAASVDPDLDEQAAEPTSQRLDEGLTHGLEAPIRLDHADGVESGAEEATELADGGSLVPFDPLSRYLAEIRRFPILTREEETEIAKRYQRYHNPEDAYRLVTANLRLVVKIANEFARASKNLLDLIQEGNVGLMEAVKNFDPYRGIRFPSYAVWWVRAYIYRYLINNWRLVKIGTTQAQRKLFFNLRKESERLEADGFVAQPKLLAQRMGVKESEVREMQERMAQSEISLDQPAGGEGNEDGAPLLEAIPDSSWDPEETISRSEWRDFAKEKVEQFANTLKDKELEIFRVRLLSDEPPTLQEVGAKFGISRERVRQIESRLKRRFKEFLKSQAADIEHAET
jgi:RNA polymerase sigma-32 factor